MAEGWHPGMQNAKAAKEAVLPVLFLGVRIPGHEPCRPDHGTNPAFAMKTQQRFKFLAIRNNYP